MRSAFEGSTPGVQEPETRAQEARLADEQRLLSAASLTWMLFWSADVLSVLRPTWDTLALRFVWAGSVEPGRQHYYRIHGPTVLVEYDNAQGQGNHSHTVLRDLENDFGGDLLRRHRQSVMH